jgi:hemerythrin-like domain-containing protein
MEQLTARQPIDVIGMLLVHGVIRREIGLMPTLVRRSAIDPGRVAHVAAHATEMLEFLHDHHVGEDTLLWPPLTPRVPDSADLIARMASDHQQVERLVERARTLLRQWSESAGSTAGEELAAAFADLGALLDSHLATEEDEILPLAARHLSQQEWDELGKHGFAAIPGKRRLAMLGYMLEGADEGERQRFAHHVPPPARLAYRLFGHRQFIREVQRLRA